MLNSLRTGITTAIATLLIIGSGRVYSQLYEDQNTKGISVELSEAYGNGNRKRKMAPGVGNISTGFRSTSERFSYAPMDREISVKLYFGSSKNKVENLKNASLNLDGTTEEKAIVNLPNSDSNTAKKKAVLKVKKRSPLATPNLFESPTQIDYFPVGVESSIENSSGQFSGSNPIAINLDGTVIRTVTQPARKKTLPSKMVPPKSVFGNNFREEIVLFEERGPSGARDTSQAELLVSSVGIEVNRLVIDLVVGEKDPLVRYPLEPIRRQIASVIESRPATMSLLEQSTLINSQKDEILAGYYPQISASAGNGSRTYDSGYGSSRVAIDGESRQKSVSVKQLLWDFWATKNSFESTNQRKEAIESQLQFQRSEVVLNGLSAILEIERCYLLLDLARANISSHRALLKLIKERETLGASSKADVVRVEARIPLALDEQATALKKLSGAQAVYREIFGDDAVKRGLPVEIPTSNIIPREIDSMLAKLPMVTQAIAAREAAAKDRDALRARNIGALTIDVSVGDRRDMMIDSSPRRDNSIFLNFNTALYTGGAATAREEQAGARFRLANIDLERVKRESEKKIRQAVSEYVGQTEAVDARLLNVKSAGQAFDVTKELYLNKRGTLLDVFSSQQDLSTATRSLIDGLVDRAISKYNLMHSTDNLRSWIESAS